MFASTLCLLNVFQMLDPLHYILQAYQLFFGFLIIVVDGPSEKFPDALRARIVGFTALLQSRANRILFYLFIGCQQASQPGLLNCLVGWYFAAVAVGFTLANCANPPRMQEGPVGPVGADGFAGTR